MPKGLCQSLLAIYNTRELDVKMAITLWKAVVHRGLSMLRGPTNLQITIQQGIVVDTLCVNMTENYANDVEPILYTVRAYP